MPSTRNREVRSTAPTPAPTTTKRGGRKGKAVEEEVTPVEAEVEAKEAAGEVEGEVESEPENSSEHHEAVGESELVGGDTEEEAEATAGVKISREDRLAKLKELRIRMVSAYLSATTPCNTY
jgi:hypothetical protein